MNLRGAYSRFSHGHVDITIYAPDNTVSKKAVSGSRYRHARRGPRGTVLFRARMPGFIPNGSTIQAVYHNGFIKPERKSESKGKVDAGTAK